MFCNVSISIYLCHAPIPPFSVVFCFFLLKTLYVSVSLAVGSQSGHSDSPSKARSPSSITGAYPRIRFMNKFVSDVVQVASKLRPLPDRPVEEVRETFANKLELSMKLAISKYKPIQVTIYLYLDARQKTSTNEADKINRLSCRSPASIQIRPVVCRLVWCQARERVPSNIGHKLKSKICPIYKE